MTEITYTNRTDDKYSTHELRLDGHAGYDPGHDIVCSSISTIITYIATVLQENFPRQYLGNGNSGHSWIVFSSYPGSKADDFAYQIFDAAVMMFAQLMAQYPKNVHFTVTYYGESQKDSACDTKGSKN
jgi:uncharacterized protein YsxB (DUF464 family)